MLLQFGPEDVPTTFDVYVDLEDALWDGVCWVPGIEDCVSPVYSVTIDTDGLYDISLPIYDACDCAYFFSPVTCQPFYYFLSFHFPNAFPTGMEPDVVTDDFPLGCTSYNDFGSGWLDLVTEYSFPGELMIWADVACCDNPVGDGACSWGKIKNLYR